MKTIDVRLQLSSIKSQISTGSGPLYQRLADATARVIGQLEAGAAMPRVRDLADGLGVSIVTVAHAYRVLGERGLLVGRPGVGTFIAAPVTPAAPAPELDERTLVWQGAFARRGAPANLPYVNELPDTCNDAPYSFFGVPSYDRDLLAATRRAMRRVAVDAEIGAGRIDSQGQPQLRAAIAAHLRADGIDVGADRVLITHSFEETLMLALLAFCRDGDAVALEDPTQFCLVDAARLRGIRIVGIPMDDRGMRTDLLESAASREQIRMVITTPRAHNPTGLELHVQRRAHLLDLARRHNWLVFECDPFAPLTYRGRPQAPLATRDSDGRVIYVRPVSRGLLLNMGAAVAAGRVLEQLIAAKDVIDRGSDMFLQLVLKRLFDAGSISRQDAKMRRRWGDQMTALLGALERAIPAGVRWTRPRGGATVWLTLPEGYSAEALLPRALEQGVSFIPGRGFGVIERHDRCLRLAIGSRSPNVVQEGAKRLGAAISAYMAETQRARPRPPVAKVS